MTRDDAIYAALSREQERLEIEILEEKLKELRWQNDSFSETMKKNIRQDLESLGRRF